MHSPVPQLGGLAGSHPAKPSRAAPTKEPLAQPTATRRAAPPPTVNSRPSPDPKPHARPTLNAIGPDGLAFAVIGQPAKALRALVEAGLRGVTALEAASWAFRFAAYVHDLRKQHGLAIETLREDHEGGWHGRYVLRSPVQLGVGGQ